MSAARGSGGPASPCVSGVPGGGAKTAPHSPQYVALSGFSSPHVRQRICAPPFPSNAGSADCSPRLPRLRRLHVPMQLRLAPASGPSRLRCTEVRVEPSPHYTRLPVTAQEAVREVVSVPVVEGDAHPACRAARMRATAAPGGLTFAPLSAILPPSGRSAVGSALGLGPRSRQFKSDRPDWRPLGEAERTTKRSPVAVM